LFVVGIDFAWSRVVLNHECNDSFVTSRYLFNLPRQRPKKVTRHHGVVGAFLQEGYGIRQQGVQTGLGARAQQNGYVVIRTTFGRDLFSNDLNLVLY
jgi:hypothetical protein